MSDQVSPLLALEANGWGALGDTWMFNASPRFELMAIPGGTSAAPLA